MKISNVNKHNLLIKGELFMLQKLICPQCGGQMELDDSCDKAICPYCGSEVANMAQKVEVKHSGTVVTKADRSNEPNLIIDFSCEEPDGRMIITFNNTKMKRVINNGQTVSMKLPLGHCVAEMDLAGRSYKRELWIVEDAPVRINASAFGRREIVIEQPDYKLPDGTVAQAPTQNNVPSGPRVKPHPFSVVGFICALTVVGGILGVVFGILGVIKSKNEKPKALAIVAIILGAIFTIGLIAAIANANKGGTAAEEAIRMLL